MATYFRRKTSTLFVQFQRSVMSCLPRHNFRFPIHRTKVTSWQWCVQNITKVASFTLGLSVWLMLMRYQPMRFYSVLLKWVKYLMMKIMVWVYKTNIYAEYNWYSLIHEFTLPTYRHRFDTWTCFKFKTLHNHVRFRMNFSGIESVCNSLHWKHTKFIFELYLISGICPEKFYQRLEKDAQNYFYQKSHIYKA